MCSQVGFILGTKDRGTEEIRYLQKIFIYLVLRSEERGPHATGAAWLDRDGKHRIYKRPTRASEFVKDRAFAELHAGVNRQTTWLAGHTRWQTRGDARNNANNHPLRASRLLGTVNGTITNADELFEQMRLPRHAEVDSELLLRIADATLRDGHIDMQALKKRLMLCRGQLSAVMASKADPETIVIIKRNKPLELRYHDESNIIVYASDRAYLDGVLLPTLGWREVCVKPMSIVRFHCNHLPEFSYVPFRLASNFQSSRTGKMTRPMKTTTETEKRSK